MKKFALSLFCIIISFTAFSQEQKEFSIKISGFVKSDYWYDSRQVNQTREGLFLIHPLDIKKDGLGVDANDGWNFNFSAITSRIWFDLKGPKAFGAETSAWIEADFSGASNQSIDNFRLRHAYFKLDWTKNQLLFGQYWHPIFTPDCFPGVLSLNTGAPFQPFVRNPQISFTHKIGKYEILLAAIAQRDNSNIGPGINGRDYIYLSNSAVPNLHAQVKYKSEHHFFGVGADYKWLKPALVTSKNIVTSSKIGSYAILAYYKYKKQGFEFKIKSVYGQNLNEHLMLGGFAVETYDSLNGETTYTATNHLNIWSSVAKTVTFKNMDVICSVFAGFSKNFGTSNNNLGIYYALGKDIDRMYRVSPSLTFKSGKVALAIEYELSSASFGTPTTSGIVSNTHDVINHRILGTGFFFF